MAAGLNAGVAEEGSRAFHFGVPELLGVVESAVGSGWTVGLVTLDPSWGGVSRLSSHWVIIIIQIQT